MKSNSSSSSSSSCWPYLSIPIKQLENRYVGNDGQWLPCPPRWLPQNIYPQDINARTQIESAMKLNNYQQIHVNEVVQTISDRISAELNPLSSLSSSSLPFLSPITPSIQTSTVPWSPTHRALLSAHELVDVMTGSSDSIIEVLTNVGMIKALSDDQAVSSSIQRDPYLQKITKTVKQELSNESFMLIPLVDIVMNYMPTYLQVGLDCQKRGDHPNAFRWFDAASQENLINDPPLIGAACYQAAQYYQNGFHGCQVLDRKRAQQLFDRAISAHVLAAYANSPGFYILICNAADNGSINAVLKIALELKFNGEQNYPRVNNNKKTYRSWWFPDIISEIKRLVVKEHDMEISFDLYRYYSRVKKQRDIYESFRYLAIAAFGGHCEAMNSLAIRYETGSGISRNLIKAFELYKCAATRGSTMGLIHLAQCYKDGTGCQMDGEKASSLALEICERGKELTLNGKKQFEMQFPEYSHLLRINLKKFIKSEIRL